MPRGFLQNLTISIRIRLCSSKAKHADAVCCRQYAVCCSSTNGKLSAELSRGSHGMLWCECQEALCLMEGGAHGMLWCRMPRSSLLNGRGGAHGMLWCECQEALCLMEGGGGGSWNALVWMPRGSLQNYYGRSWNALVRMPRGSLQNFIKGN